MKHGKKPTRTQRRVLEDNGLIPSNWLVTKDTPDEMHIVHIYSDNNRKIINKGGYTYAD